MKPEEFTFRWLGDTEAIAQAETAPRSTLQHAESESVSPSATNNLFIEGDNLEAMKLLLEQYHGAIKMIYIDPPYNTGKKFLYNDKRSHSEWLNLMYPRLYVARKLLRDDGVIFISIDDHEQHRLRMICDKIFGEENFVDTVIWEKVHTRKNSAKYFSSSHEYVLCYCKDKNVWHRNLLPREQVSAYKNPDNDPKGPWKPDPITAHNYYGANYTITKPNGVVLGPPQGRYWCFSEGSWRKKVENEEVLWGDGAAYPMIKRYLSQVQMGLVPTTLFSRDFAGDTSKARVELSDLMGHENIIDYTKPTRLINRMLQISTSVDSNHIAPDIILDFFAGSCTTAHAVMKLNAEDGGNRKFIMVQLPEPCGEKSEAWKAGYQTIADIGKERIRRAGKKITEECKAAGKQCPDIGFRVLKINGEGEKTIPPHCIVS